MRMQTKNQLSIWSVKGKSPICLQRDLQGSYEDMFRIPDLTFFYIGLLYLHFVLTYSKGDQNGAKLTE